MRRRTFLKAALGILAGAPVARSLLEEPAPDFYGTSIMEQLEPLQDHVNDAMRCYVGGRGGGKTELIRQIRYQHQMLKNRQLRAMADMFYGRAAE